jgi:flavin-dependent dehydrogenase
LKAAVVIDATGRRVSRMLTSCGGDRHVSDRLVCSWLRICQKVFPPGVIQIEAEPDGWWYATNVPDGAVLAFHTDSDLYAARRSRAAEAILNAAKCLPMLSTYITDRHWKHAQPGFCAAYTSWIEQPAADGWIAVGDAALTFDPLSSQGLFNALYFGFAGAEAVDRYLNGDSVAMREYANEVHSVKAEFTHNHLAWYRLERRWARRPFWLRRQTPEDYRQ